MNCEMTGCPYPAEWLLLWGKTADGEIHGGNLCREHHAYLEEFLDSPYGERAYAYAAEEL